MKSIVYYIRKWHIWIGVIFTIPLLIIAITGVIFAIQDNFKNKPNEPQVNVSWLPGYSAAAFKYEFEKRSKEVFSVALSSDSTLFFGTGAGVFYTKNHHSGFIPGLAGVEIRSVLVSNDFLFAGGKQGLFKVQLSDKSISAILSNDIHSIYLSNDTTLIVSDKKTIFSSTDGGLSWEKSKASEAFDINQLEVELVSSHKIPLHKLNMDLHNGKAFFGKKYEWIWIVIVSLSIFLLTFSGIYMWFRRQFKKKSKR